MTLNREPRPTVFVWENFGPLHAARAEAVALALGRRVVGIELFSRSQVYGWETPEPTGFEKITLRRDGGTGGGLLWPLLRALARIRPAAVFFCHYERPDVMLAAWVCRLFGVTTFVMNDSKFDDYPRHLWREVIKSAFYRPYHGAIAASARSRDYLRFLGVPADRIEMHYDCVPVDAIRRLAGAPPAPDGAPFSARHFTVVARHVPKKNIGLAIEAFALTRAAGSGRRLVLCGSGPLEGQLRAQAAALGIADHVEFRGFVQADEVARVLGQTLALILPSTEEQYGQVVAEAMALGVPALVSDRCGARDELVRSLVNGFVFEPDNAAGLARMMGLLDRDEALWRDMAARCAGTAAQVDLPPFVESVRRLLARTGKGPAEPGNPAPGPGVVAPAPQDSHEPGPSAGRPSITAPIAVFAYRRPAHLHRALTALSACPEFGASPVFIFIDGPRPGAEAAVAKTAEVAARFAGPNVTVVRQPTNRGLANSIIAEVTALCERYGRVIVIEDDLVVHPTTLAWLNQGLDAYADDPRVMQISAYQYRVPEFEGRSHGTFQRFATTWGWATWKRAWDHFDPAATGWEAIGGSGPARAAFDADDAYPFSDMLVRQMNGQLDSWGIRWSWAVHRSGGLTLMPPRTLVRNDGFIDAATHNTLGWAKRFALGASPRPWTGQAAPGLPPEVSRSDADARAFRRGLLRTHARRNARIKAVLARLGLKRFA
ncbi:glycosyltransferase [Brevundimonas sp.]|uniref:glycosyltransferase n=1 Tax=Brevundimonas sp. TaxID=1871086 RepID=UPI00391B238B